jgi:hypothetical protein
MIKNSPEEEKERTLYGWAFKAGKEILGKLEATYGKEGAEKRMETILLNLRSELLPDKFRRELINTIVEVRPKIGIPVEVKTEQSWRINEFYRYSAAILAGFFDSLQFWKGWEREGKEAQIEGM